MRRALPHLRFPLVVGAMFLYALATPRLELAAWLGLPASLDAALRPASAVGLFYPLLAWLERVFPHRAAWNRPQGDVVSDVLHLVVTSQAAQALVGAVVVGPLALLSTWVSGAAGGSLWPSAAPLWLQLCLALVVGEFGHYVFHRVSHERPLVWRLHATHHGAERLYWLNATRFHLLDLVLLLSFESLGLALLGAQGAVLGPYLAFRAVYGQVQHCNIEMPTPRWIDWLWSSPNVHRWHHSTVSAEGNHNYGAVLNVWDHVFRSFFRPDAPFAGPVGIGQLPRFPRGYLAQQISPFRWAETVRRSRGAVRTG